MVQTEDRSEQDATPISNVDLEFVEVSQALETIRRVLIAGGQDTTVENARSMIVNSEYREEIINNADLDPFVDERVKAIFDDERGSDVPDDMVPLLHRLDSVLSES